MANPRTESPYSAAVDAIQVPTNTLVSGSAGTSDTAGTAEVIRWGGNPSTGAAYVQLIGTSIVVGGGGSQYSEGSLVGTLAGIGTLIGNVILFPSPFDSSLMVPNYTTGFPTYITGGNAIAIGPSVTPGTTTISLGKAEDSGHASGDVGVLSLAVRNDNQSAFTNTDLDYSAFAVDANGNQRIIGEANNGVNSVGAPVKIGGKANSAAPSNVSNNQAVDAWFLLNGAQMVNLFGGTLGTLTNLGSASNVGSISNAGSLTNVGTVKEVTTVPTITTVSNLTNGSVNILTGSVVGTVVNNGGSVQIYQGTSQLNMVPVVAGTSYGTQGTAGGATWGTLVSASGAGTKQYVSGVDIVVTSGTVDVAVTNVGVGGSSGNGVLVRGQFVPSGGISKNFNPVQASGTNGTLAYWLGGAGTAFITIQYWQGV